LLNKIKGVLIFGGIIMRKPTLYKQRGVWYARFWNEKEVRYHSKSLGVPVEGKKERRQEAAEKALKMAADIEAKTAESQTINSPASVPLLEYVENFWRKDGKYVKEKALLENKPLSKNYIDGNHGDIKLRIKPFPGFTGITIEGLKKTTIHEWKLWMAENGESGRMINKAMQTLKVAVNHAFSLDIIAQNPFSGISRARYNEKQRGILTPAEIKTLVDTPITDPRSRLAIYLPLYCSMRMGEVRGLQWSDISDGIIHIRHNWQEGEGLKKCKCGSEGYVPMPRLVAELINKVYNIAPLTGSEDFVMANKPYHPICREYLWEALRNELSTIGINEQQRKERNIVYHSLRHSFVTACRIAGLSDFETMTLSRHKDIKMLERYSHGKEAIDIKAVGAKLEKSLLPESAKVL
jgi:integrase